jgi:hypothetical protein
MATFLVKPRGPAHVTLVIPTDKGRATVKLPVTPHGPAGRIVLSDKHVDFIDPAHARHMIRLDEPAPAAPAPAEEPTRPDLPATVGGRREHVTG